MYNNLIDEMSRNIFKTVNPKYEIYSDPVTFKPRPDIYLKS